MLGRVMWYGAWIISMLWYYMVCGLALFRTLGTDESSWIFMSYVLEKVEGIEAFRKWGWYDYQMFMTLF